MIDGITDFRLDKVLELYNVTYTYNTFRDRVKVETLYKKKRTSLVELRGLDRFSDNMEYYQSLQDFVIRYDKVVHKNMVAKYNNDTYEITYIAEIGRGKYLKLRLKKIEN